MDDIKQRVSIMAKNMTLLEAIEELEARIKKGKKHYLYDCGICENLANIGKMYYTFELKQMFFGWKQFSGNVNYPIDDVRSYNLHKLNETLWVGDQLKKRLDLIKYIKKSLEKTNEST